jgi:predicted peptidase
MRFFIPLTCAALCLVGGLSAEAPVTTAKSFESEITLKLGYKYTLTLPEGYEADEAKSWPLLIFLHGAGERGDNLELLKKHGPPKLVASGKKFPAIVVSPQVPSGEFWNPHGVKALVDQVKKDYRVDAKRVYLTGISMGGFGTFDTITAYPDVFAAAAPICGGAGINVVKFGPLKDLPIWMFHGAKDPVVPVEFTGMAEKWFKRNGGGANVKVTIYPEAQHDSWTQAYENEELWTWLFQQARK